MKEYRLPKRSEDLRIKHFASFKEYDEDGMELSDKVRFVASFLNVHANEVWAINKDDFDKMYSHIINLMAHLKIDNKPPQSIKMNGIEFELIDPHKVGTCWHQDWNLCDIEKDPVMLACLFYHPKGHFYGEIDAQKNLKHPIRWKREIFENHLPLNVFISCARFFLVNWLRSTSKSLEQEKWKLRTQKSLLYLKKFTRFRKSST